MLHLQADSFITYVSTAKMVDSPLDVILLRNALRLVHCIQKERGTSLYFLADKQTFEDAMKRARSASDVSVKFLQQKAISIQSTLTKIRSLISSQKESDDELVSHRIFTCFNILTSGIVRDFIIPQVPGKYHKTIIKKSHRRRSISMDVNDKLFQNLTPVTPENSVGKNMNSVESLENSPSTKSLDSGSNLKQGNHGLDSIEQELLNLLHIFVQLKESAGIERSILSSQVVFQTQQNNSIRMMLNDLVLQVENQRSLLNQLEQLPDGHHRNLVLELSKLSPRLKELQTVILNDFEALQKQKYDSESLWILLTQYIDKLHSVELLIIEDLEISIANSNLSNIPGLLPPLQTQIYKQRLPEQQQALPSSIDLTQALQERLSKSTDNQDLASQIESMAAEEVKASIMAALRGEEKEKTPKATITTKSKNLTDPRTKNLNENLQQAIQDSLSRSKGKEWDISIYEIKFNKRIGLGASATTYLADWSGQKVAVKVASITEFGLDGWRREVAALQRLHHPNVIRLLGSIEHPNPLTYCLVLEYCSAGDLNTVLKYATPKNFFFHVAICIANAMAYLHSRCIIHRDLKPANVLCHGNVTTGNFSVKVTDFGVAADEFGLKVDGGNVSGYVPDDVALERNLTGETGTYRWMAPEVIRHEPYSAMADVYSFAIIIWQLVTRDEPFQDVDAIEAAKLVANEKMRPPLPENIPQTIANLINVNWSDNSSDRWKFEKVAESLDEIKSSITFEERTFLDAAEGHPVYVYEEAEMRAGPSDLNIKAKKPPTKASNLLGNFFGMQKKFGKGKGK